ncbi:MAG: hypothetical protein QS721_07995 [Candidatus Endonucleobacter sp. (ex Gigantidas childressi)]|nr:hypothetical protein [Candidatus Endonucleobacter sp. (ex Gigantidas childressi)]
MFLLYRYGKCFQPFVVLFFMLFCGASCWAGISIVNEGKAFSCESFNEPWELLYSLSSPVICQDIKEKYEEDSITYYDNKSNIVISKVQMVHVDKIIENTTMFSINTIKPAFFVYLEDTGASSSREPMSPLMVFKNGSANGNEINIEIRNSNKELSVLKVPWVTVNTMGGDFVCDKDTGQGTISYCRKDEVRSSEVVEGGRGKVYNHFDYLCGHCGGLELDVGPSICSCGSLYKVETKLSLSFKVLGSTDETDSLGAAECICELLGCILDYQ